MELLLDGHFEKKHGWQARLGALQLKLWRAQFPAEVNEITGIEADMRKALAAPPDVSQSLDLQSDHFLSQLTDTEIIVIQQLHKSNHSIAQQAGYVEYNHRDPNQATAYHTAWAASNNQGGDWSTQYHMTDPYTTQNNGYPNAPPNQMGNPWPGAQQQQQSPGLTGTLITSGLAFLSGGNKNQQPSYQAPPPQRPYWQQ